MRGVELDCERLGGSGLDGLDGCASDVCFIQADHLVHRDFASVGVRIHSIVGDLHCEI